MFRIAKPESFVLRSPNKHEVTYPLSREWRVLKSVSTGWRAERGRMYALDNGAIIRLLYQPSRRTGFPIALPLRYGRIQLLLFDMPRSCDTF